MIDSNSFMDFFEKEYGVKYIDAKTGKTRQELMAEIEANMNCGNCRWGLRGVITIILKTLFAQTQIQIMLLNL
jgi:hypothetical protein